MQLRAHIAQEVQEGLAGVNDDNESVLRRQAWPTAHPLHRMHMAAFAAALKCETRLHWVATYCSCLADTSVSHHCMLGAQLDLLLLRIPATMQKASGRAEHVPQQAELQTLLTPHCSSSAQQLCMESFVHGIMASSDRCTTAGPWSGPSSDGCTVRCSMGSGDNVRFTVHKSKCCQARQLEMVPRTSSVRCVLEDKHSGAEWAGAKYEPMPESAWRPSY
jgi:hypothetical protein